MTKTPASEAARRRTFAIISHPDAGKTTLTEHLLLLGAEGNLVVEPNCIAPRFELPVAAPETGP